MGKDKRVGIQFHGSQVKKNVMFSPEMFSVSHIARMTEERSFKSKRKWKCSHFVLKIIL